MVCACTGKITRAELAQVPTPLATTTHVPIPHLAVVEGLVETLIRSHIGVVGEEFAVSKDELRWMPIRDRNPECQYQALPAVLHRRSARVRVSQPRLSGFITREKGIPKGTSQRDHSSGSGVPQVIDVSATSRDYCRRLAAKEPQISTCDRCLFAGFLHGILPFFPCKMRIL